MSESKFIPFRVLTSTFIFYLIVRCSFFNIFQVTMTIQGIPTQTQTDIYQSLLDLSNDCLVTTFGGLDPYKIGS